MSRNLETATESKQELIRDLVHAISNSGTLEELAVLDDRVQGFLEGQNNLKKGREAVNEQELYLFNRFLEWCHAFGVNTEHPDDWKDWWECWKAAIAANILEGR